MVELKKEIEVSLTDFVDFVCKSGSAKMTKVKQVKNRDKYSPATDFYKALREGIVEIHQTKALKKNLNDILDNIKDTKKINNYQECLHGYKKFWGRKQLNWFVPPFKHWVLGELDVRINPELGLKIEGKYYIIKLYFKSEKLSKDKVTQILTLMESQLRNLVGDEPIMAILDVKNSKLFQNEVKDVSLLPLLEGEARSFETIWKGI